ncbi:ATP-binding protein [Archangium violaceum]|uniref:sensor histidine kinase n=1 Tax=Archangium violaceum TaxID=83451 RepID=UPI002B2E020B|nr:ATP-binding protein [Archangium gephyra]
MPWLRILKLPIARWAAAVLASGPALGIGVLFKPREPTFLLVALAMVAASAAYGGLVPALLTLPLAIGVSLFNAHARSTSRKPLASRLDAEGESLRRALSKEQRDQALFHSAIEQFGQRLVSRPDLPSFLHEAVFLLANTLEVELVELLELSSDRQALHLRAGAGWKEEGARQLCQEMGKRSPAGFALLTREPVLIEALPEEERFQVPPRLRDHGAVSGLCVVIEGVDSSFGVLGAYTRTRRSFTQAELQFVRGAAGVLTRAIRLQQQFEAKRHLEEWLQLLAEELRDYVLCLLSPTGHVTDWNAGAERLTGWKAEEILGQDLSRFYPAELVARGKTGRALRMAEAEGRFEEVGYRVRKDGSRFWADMVLTTLHAPGGAIRGFSLVMKDRTSLRQAEEERGRLVEQLAEEERLAAVLTQLPAGVLIAEIPSGRTVLWNRQTEEISRLPFQPFASLEEYQHHRRILRFHPDGRAYQPHDLPLARTILTGEVVKDEEMIIERGDGTRGVVLVSAAPVRDAEGQPIWAVLTLIDVTERKKAEESQRFLAEASRILGESLELEETLTRLEHLDFHQSTNGCGFLLLEEDGSPERLSADVPPARAALLHAVLRHTVGEVLETGRPLLVPEVGEQHLRALAPDEEHLRQFREAPLVSYVVVPLVARGRIIGVIGYVSTRRESPFGQQELATVEELARRAALAIDNARLYQQAQDAIRARDELFSIAAHELRTPLNALHLKAQVLQRSLHKQPALEQDNRFGEGIQVIAQQADRLSRMIGNLLDISRIRVGQLQLEPEELNLASLVKDVVERMRESLGAAGCELHMELTETAPGQWDRMRLEQVVTNLLSNALKYGVGKPIEVRVWEHERWVMLSVRDHGIGIPPDKLEHIFGRFERAVSGRQFAGLGLGLYVTRQIIDEHGGRIRVESHPGEGSTFTVELPRTG